MSAVGPRMARGICRASSRASPAARMPTAVALGGIEECPPSARAVSSTVTYPFSAIPMSATGAATPVIRPVASAPPSSSTNSGWTLREARVRAGPLVQQAVAVHLLQLEGGVEFREGVPQVAMQSLELARVELAGVLERDRLEAQRAGEPARQRRGVERLDGHRNHLGLARAEARGALERDRGEHDDDQGQRQENTLHGTPKKEMVRRRVATKETPRPEPPGRPRTRPPHAPRAVAARSRRAKKIAGTGPT